MLLPSVTAADRPVRVGIWMAGSLLASLATAATASETGPQPELRHHGDAPAAMVQFVERLLAVRQEAVDRERMDVSVVAELTVLDLNDDGAPDFLLTFDDLFHCGAGVCPTQIYVSDAELSWRAAHIFHGGEWRLLDEWENGFSRLAYDAFVTAGVVQAVLAWDGEFYGEVEFRDGEHVSHPFDASLRASVEAPVRAAPEPDAALLHRLEEGEMVQPWARLEGGDWYMVLLSPTVAGYVAASDLVPEVDED